MSTARLFERLAARYDAWYEEPAGAAMFAAEVECLRPLLAGLPRPWAQVGTGSGRFAAALGWTWAHPFYSAARFLTRQERLALTAGRGPAVAGRPVRPVPAAFRHAQAGTTARRGDRSGAHVALAQVQLDERLGRPGPGLGEHRRRRVDAGHWSPRPPARLG